MRNCGCRNARARSGVLNVELALAKIVVVPVGSGEM